MNRITVIYVIFSMFVLFVSTMITNSVYISSNQRTCMVISENEVWVLPAWKFKCHRLESGDTKCVFLGNNVLTFGFEQQSITSSDIISSCNQAKDRTWSFPYLSKTSKRM